MRLGSFRSKDAHCDLRDRWRGRLLWSTTGPNRRGHHVHRALPAPKGDSSACRIDTPRLSLLNLAKVARAGRSVMAEARVERRLAAILAADVAGYSRLMGTDEEGTLATLKA